MLIKIMGCMVEAGIASPDWRCKAIALLAQHHDEGCDFGITGHGLMNELQGVTL